MNMSATANAVKGHRLGYVNEIIRRINGNVGLVLGHIEEGRAMSFECLNC